MFAFTPDRGNQISWQAPSGRVRPSIFQLFATISLLASFSVCAAPPLAKPQWESDGDIQTDTGRAAIAWSIPDGATAEFFRLDEQFRGTSSSSYVVERSISVFRSIPGDYEFRVSSCIREGGDTVKCGPPSQRLKFTVTEAIDAPIAEQGPVDPNTIPPEPVGSQSIAGGPDDLNPGLWMESTGAKGNQGWSFYWANRLALTSNPTNAYDVHGIWYTYEAKKYEIFDCANYPSCDRIYSEYRPVVVTMNMIQVGSNSFQGALSVRRNGTNDNIGSATVTFGANNDEAQIQWLADLPGVEGALWRWGDMLELNTDALHLVPGLQDENPFNNPSDLAGLWTPNSGTDDYFIVDNIAADNELIEVIFYDDSGDPVWIQAEYLEVIQGSTPIAGKENLCYYYLDGGYPPGREAGGSVPYPGSWFTTCQDLESPTSSSNRNGTREFTAFEQARYWVNFQLPATGGLTGGSVSIGTSSNPAYFSKQANFHRIFINGANSCEFTAGSSCDAQLTWFTDAHYPTASAFTYKLPSGPRTLVGTSTDPAMVNQTHAFDEAGTYRFELHQTTNANSRIIANSSTFTVTENTPSGAPDAPTGLNASWDNQQNRIALLAWSHSDTSSVDHYVLEENTPESTVNQYTVQGGTNLSTPVSYAGRSDGIYQYRVKACDSSDLCSSYTAWISWAVSDDPLEHPWGDNGYGSGPIEDVSWQYAMGYHFTPLVNGEVRELGGYFNGTKTVKLLEKNGPELAVTTITAANDWAYQTIPPVAVSAGTEYTVVVYLNGSGGSYREGTDFPDTFGNITIEGSTWALTSSDPDAIPTNTYPFSMYGQVDIGFFAGSGPTNQAPSISPPIPDRTDQEGDSVSFSVTATDPEGDDLTFSIDPAGDPLPAGITMDTDGNFSGTIAAGASNSSPYTITVEVADTQPLIDTDTFVWTIDPAPPGGECTIVFEDDFETDKMWARNLQGSDTASRGLWERANPEETSYNGLIYQLGNAVSGSYTLVTDGTSGTTAYTYDVDGGATTISSPIINLPADGTAHTLGFDYNFAYRSKSTSANRFAAYVVDNGGVETLLFEEINEISTDHAGEWAHLDIDISAFAGQSIRIKFLAEDDQGTGDLVEAQVDDVKVCYTPNTGSGEANPELPPAPATPPSMVPSESSSSAGATAGAFRVDESGSATYSIPILTAPGSGGMAPQISLEYSSQGGNGIAGLGWTIGGLSSITRCGQTLAQDGPDAELGINLTSSDRFCLDGERLILVSGGAYGAPGAEYRPERDDITKIISNGDVGDEGSGPVSFTVYRKDGTVSQYGQTEDSRIQARATEDDTVLVWAQNRITDSTSNYIEFVYNEFFGAPGEPIEFILDRVLYTANERAQSLHYAQVVFKYQDNPLKRDDATQRSIAGSTIAQTKLLTSIKSEAKVNPSDADFKTLRYYSLDHEQDEYGRNILVSAAECSDSTLDVCFGPIDFGWHTSLHEINSTPASVNTDVFTDEFKNLALADINGDARPDAIITEKSGSNYHFRYAFALKNGGFSAPSTQSFPISSYTNQFGEFPVNVLPVDLNADGYQDVVYPTQNDWKGRLSTGSGLGSEFTVVANCCDSLTAEFSQIMDIDGDGLADLVTSAKLGGEGRPVAFLRNKFVPPMDPLAAPEDQYGFEVVNGSMNTESIDDVFPKDYGSFEQVLGAAVRIEEWSAVISDQQASVFDLNGDGRADILARLSMNYCRSSDNDCPQDLSRTPESPLGAETFLAQFYVVLISSPDPLGGYGFVPQEIIAIGKDCNTQMALCSSSHPLASANVPTARDFRVADINADGLGDFVYRQLDGQWFAQLNRGNGFAPNPSLIADVDDDDIASQTRIQDLNGDGFPEFLYPTVSSGNALWRVHKNQHGVVSTSSATSVSAGNRLDGDISLLVDFTGDGIVDHYFIDRDAAGTVINASTKFYLGENSVTGNDYAPTVIDYIASGVHPNKQSTTLVTYLPLTDDLVYSRLSDSAGVEWSDGRGVYDLIAPTYVVRVVATSAPTFNISDNMATVSYHYVGAKLEAGGRGFLGFSEIVSFDAQSGVRTNTRYRQDFPFVGMPADTTQALPSISRYWAPITDLGQDAPIAWGTVTASTEPPSLPASDNEFSYAINQLAKSETVANKGTWFPFVSGSLERTYTLGGEFSRKVLTNHSYDQYANLTYSLVRTYETDSTTALKSETTINYFDDEDVASWHLGRLTETEVHHFRSGMGSIMRRSRFEYDEVTGVLDKEIVEPLLSTFRITTDYQLDDFGNRISVVVTGDGMSPRTTNYLYDPLGRYVDQSQNSFGQITERVLQRDAFGNPLLIENIDGIQTTNVYDHMGRLYGSHTETGQWTTVINVASVSGLCPGAVAHYRVTSAGGAATALQCFDALSREIRTAVVGHGGQFINTDTYYDDSGRVERVSEPYISSGQAHWNITQYDGVGRVTAITAADGNDMTYAYDENAKYESPVHECVIPGASRQVRVKNGLDQYRLEVRNALGEVTTVFDDDCGTLEYEYDSIGNLTQITGVDGATTTMLYDLAGRKTYLDDPDTGVRQYKYNALGELIRQLDSENQAIDFEYDTLGRVTDRRELSGVSSLTDTTYTVENHEVTTWINTTSSSVTGKGQMSQAVYREGESGAIVEQREYFYDDFGRVDIVSTTQDGLQLSEQTTYDEFSRVFQQFDASGDSRGLRYVYDSNGYLQQVREAREGVNGTVYQTIVSMDQRGNITSMDLGNGVEIDAMYNDATGRLESLSAEHSLSGILQLTDYTWDVLGNLTNRDDQVDQFEEDFYYDALNRLERISLTLNGTSQGDILNVSYNSAGNITSKTDVGSYFYGAGNAGPHAVTSAGGVTYSYDNNGNQRSSSDGRVIDYTVFNKPTLITKGTASTEFVYGIGNSRIRRIDDNNVDGDKTTWYFGSVERIEEGSEIKFRRYLAGVAIAEFYPASEQQNIQYLIKDHLGSIHAVTSETGQLVERMSFTAFGQRRVAGSASLLGTMGLQDVNAISTRGFTGHEHADGLGVIHMNGRIYDPRLGRFLQADPIIQFPRNGQSLNRYSYVLNNPLSAIDPSGYSLKRIFERVIRPLAAIALSAWQPWGTGIWGPALWGAASGWIAAGNSRGLLAGAFAGAAFGAIGSHFDKFANGLSRMQYAAKTVAHGLVGGVQNLIQGGKFGHGFVSAGFTSAFAEPIGRLDPNTIGISGQRVLAAAVVGGTASRLTGGKFANGAVTGAFSRAFNDDLHEELGKLTRFVKYNLQLADLSKAEFEILFEVNLVDDFDLMFHVGTLEQQLATNFLDYDRTALADSIREVLEQEYKGAALVGASRLRRFLYIKAFSRVAGMDERYIRALWRSERVISEVKSVQPSLKGVAQGLLRGDESVREVFYGD